MYIAAIFNNITKKIIFYGFFYLIYCLMFTNIKLERHIRLTKICRYDIVNLWNSCKINLIRGVIPMD